MKILVLGSDGQIGKPLCKKLRDNGHTVYSVDIKSGLDLRTANISLSIQRFFKEADFCFFLAFDVGGSKYLKTYENSFEFCRNNILIMEQTFSLLTEFKLPFIFASSQMSNMTYSNYGVLKLLGEKLCKTTNMPQASIVKFWNVYDWEDEDEKAHVITDFVKSALTRKEINCMTDGKEVRQFLHVDDCTDVLIKIMEDGTFTCDDEIHITSYEWVSIKTIANEIARLIPGTTVTFGENTDTVQLDKQNNPNTLLYDKLGWMPKHTLTSGLKDVILKAEQTL